MRVLVCGGRDFDNWGLVLRAMQKHIGLFRGPNPNITIIQGGAKGADFLAKVYAKWVGFSHVEYPADWNKWGPKLAGSKRNQQMLDEGKPDLVIAFPGGSGTKDMVTRANKAGVKVIEIK